MPPNHQITKSHKRYQFDYLCFINFGVLLFWCQNNYFSEGAQSLKLKETVDEEVIFVSKDEAFHYLFVLQIVHRPEIFIEPA